MTKQTRPLDVIDADIARAQGAQREFRRANRGPFREDLAGRAEQAIETARSRLAALATQEVMFGVMPLDSPAAAALAVAASRCSPVAEEALRAAAERLASDATESRADVERVISEYDAKIAALEQERREAEKQAALAAVEESFA